MNENIYTFTAAQREHVAVMVRQSQEIERQLRGFLNYVIRENNLPAVEGGYTLTQDASGLTRQNPVMENK